MNDKLGSIIQSFNFALGNKTPLIYLLVSFLFFNQTPPPSSLSLNNESRHGRSIVALRAVT